MQFDQINANIRSRTPWEGADLGFALARQWFWPLWRLWWCTALPVTLLAVLALHRWPTAVALAVWWLKPLYEPLLLFWLSRRLFGEELSLRETLGEWRRILRPRLLANLTLRRFSPNRSFYMPVSHLEGLLKGEARSKRLKVLSGDGTAPFWLTIIGAHIEMILCYSMIILLFYLIPDQLLPDSMWQMLKEGNSTFIWISNSLWLLAISLFAPFYVAGGFALYLTRRSQLEAWDLELTFRRIAPRLKLARSTAALLVGCALFIGMAAPNRPAMAEESTFPSHQESQVLIKQVLADKAFGEKHEEKYWKYLGEKKEQQKKNKPDLAWVAIVARLLEVVLWVGAAVLLGWLLLYLLRFMKAYKPPQEVKDESLPTVLFGMPVTPESLPNDISATIREMLKEQRIRAALSLLYRATLIRLIHTHQLRIPDSATEGECQDIVSAQRPVEESGFFSRLTRAWVWCAYGETTPSPADIDQLLSDWQQLYGTEHHA